MSISKRPKEQKSFRESDATKVQEDEVVNTRLATEAYSGHKLGFNAFQEADVSLAELHKHCKLVRDLRAVKDRKNARACECCGLPLVTVTQDAPLYPLLSSPRDLQDLGPGFPQYFWLLQYLIAVLTGTFCIAGLPALIDFALAENYRDWDREKNWAIVISAGNKGDYRDRDDVIPLWQSILHIVAMILILISYLFVRRWILMQEDEIDKDTITPSDYTVWIKGLPKEFTNEDLAKHLRDNGRADGKPSEVVKINVPIHIWEFVSTVREANSIKRGLLLREKNWVKAGCCAKSVPSKEELEEKLNACQQKLHSLENSSKEVRLPQAFVTFGTQKDADLVLDVLTTTPLQRFFQRICGHGSFESLQFQGRRIHATKAPDPSDILWENLHVTLWKRLGNMMLTSLVTLIMLAACGGMIYGCSYYKYELYKDYKEKEETDGADLVKFRVSSILPAIGVIFINFILSRSIRKFSLYEQPHTFTKYTTSVAFKLILAMCINTALIPILVENDKDESWFTPGGLAVEMTLIYITNAIVPPLLYIFSPMYIVRLVRRCKVRRSPKGLFQAEANAIFEGPQVDMAQRYANALKTVIISFAYAPLVPVGVLFGLVALGVSYWVDKVMLLRRHARPQRMSGDLARSMLRAVPWAVVVYAVSSTQVMNFVFINELNEDYSSPAFVWMWIAIGVALFPTSVFRGCCKRALDLRLARTLNTLHYSAVAVSFIDDYDRSNPFTQKEGWTHYLALLEKQKVIDGKVQQELMGQVHSVRSFVENYAAAGLDRRQGREWRQANPLELFQLQMLQRLSSDTAQQPLTNASLPPPSYAGPMLYGAGYYGRYTPMPQAVPQQPLYPQAVYPQNSVPPTYPQPLYVQHPPTAPQYQPAYVVPQYR